MSDTNLSTPIKVTVSNISDIDVGFVPYRECFAKKLPAKSSLTFTADTAEQVLYYKKQNDRKLCVGIANSDSAKVVAGAFESNAFIDKAPFALAQDGNNFVINGYLPHRNADAYSTGGPTATFKISNPDVTSQSQLPSGTICKVTNTTRPSGYNEYDKSAFELDGSLIVIFNLAPGDMKTREVKIAWESADEFTTYTFDLGNVIYGRPGESAPVIANSEISYPQNVTFTNSSDHAISIMPYKQNVTFAVPANDSLTLSITKPELVMYYLEQNENKFAVSL